ncbi:MAG: OmpA family protein [Gammaproteobacteria bacterium]|jgi:outer membrane protein OmpA-like peptidoglycan-associated protein
MSNWRRWLIPLLFAVTVQGCATGPKLTQEQILSQYEQIARLDRSLRDARVQGVDDLAPDGYRAAQEQLDKALSEAAADRSDSANKAAAEGLQTLSRAGEQADVSRDLLREVLAAREKALDAGAGSIFPERSADLDEEFRKVANLVERNRLEDAKERRPRLIAGYEQLELAALKEGTVEAAQAAIEDARQKDAPKYAPKTFKLAEEEMGLALSVLEADRTRTEKANAHAKRAKWLAEKSASVTELIKDFDRRDFTREDAVLWYQSQLKEISAPLGESLPFNEPNRTVVLSLQRSIQDLMKQRDETAAQRSRYEQELSLTAEQRAAIEKVQSLFTPSEANVYQQRENVLISAHGFRFPSGGSKIEAENFTLMNKIIQAVKTFPDASIEISGHTDSTGSAQVNKQLSQRRAENVARFLVEVGGISPSRIIATGYGRERPVASNETPEGRAANRRVEILINNS